MANAVKQLQTIYRELPPEEQEMLLAFAQFLRVRTSQKSSTSQPSQPLSIPRPENESVIAAIKRLSQSYPMLDKSRLLNETSAIVTGIVQDRNVVELVDELEHIFARHYQTYMENQSAE
jgi:hypothetical protein